MTAIVVNATGAQPGCPSVDGLLPAADQSHNIHTKYPYASRSSRCALATDGFRCSLACLSQFLWIVLAVESLARPLNQYPLLRDEGDRIGISLSRPRPPSILSASPRSLNPINCRM